VQSAVMLCVVAMGVLAVCSAGCAGLKSKREGGFRIFDETLAVSACVCALHVGVCACVRVCVWTLGEQIAGMRETGGGRVPIVWI